MKDITTRILIVIFLLVSIIALQVPSMLAYDGIDVHLVLKICAHLMITMVGLACSYAVIPMSLAIAQGIYAFTHWILTGKAKCNHKITELLDDLVPPDPY